VGTKVVAALTVTTVRGVVALIDIGVLTGPGVVAELAFAAIVSVGVIVAIMINVLYFV
tara:strand:+ start:3138 stop:3311 length:174 start_codon:yes stop_codon:yes gene_type:complete